MHAKKASQTNADVYHEFVVQRFLWPFATNWMKAKKDGRMEAFWQEVRDNLETYDKEQPPRRRLQNPAQPLANEVSNPAQPSSNNVSYPAQPSANNISNASGLQNPASAQARALEIQKPTGQSLEKTGHQIPTGYHGKSIGQVQAAAPATLHIPPPAQHSLPFQTPPTSTPLPVAVSKLRGRSPAPVAGPSKPRPPLHRRTTSLTSSVSSSYIEGHRIAWTAEPTTQIEALEVREDHNHGNDSDEYLPNIKVKHEAKGKAKMKEPVRKDEKRVRKQPESTGQMRKKQCKRCDRLEIDCYDQTMGTACLGCALVKMRCEEVDGKGVKKTSVAKEKKKTTKPATKKTRQPATRGPATTQGADLRTISRGTSSSSDTPSPSGRPSKRRASSPPPFQPSAKRRTMSKKAEGKRPAMDDTVGDDITELREEIRRQRGLLDAVLPGYMRLKDTVAEMEKNIDEMRRAMNEYEDVSDSHFRKISSIDIRCDEYNARMERLEFGGESSDDSVQIVSRPGSEVKVYRPETKMRKEEAPATVPIGWPVEKRDETGTTDEDRDFNGFVDIDQVNVRPVEEERATTEVRSLEDLRPVEEVDAVEDVRPVKEVGPVDAVAPVVVVEDAKDESSTLNTESVSTNMPPPPSPLSPPTGGSDHAPSPPPPTPAVTLQPPTPLTSQEDKVAESTTLLDVPNTSLADQRPDPGTQLPDVSQSKSAKSRARSTSVAMTEPRRSPRLRSQSPLPPSSLPAKRSSDNSVDQPAVKKARDA
jgi:hypothetical protein